MPVVPASVVMVRGDMLVRYSDATDLPYINHLSKQESFALGWIPEQIYQRVWGVITPVFSGWILIAEVNGDPIGYCFAAPSSHPSRAGRIYQLAVQADARRYEYGTFLVDSVESIARNEGTKAISLRCAVDLPSNSFWEILGYKTTKVVRPGSQVGDSTRLVRRSLNLRYKPLMPTLWSEVNDGITIR